MWIETDQTRNDTLALVGIKSPRVNAIKKTIHNGPCRGAIGKYLSAFNKDHDPVSSKCCADCGRTSLLLYDREMPRRKI